MISTQYVDRNSINLLYFFGYKTVFFPLPKQSQISRSVLEDGSRYLGLFRKGENHIIAKFYRNNLVICSHSREGKTLSYSQINTVLIFSLRPASSHSVYFSNIKRFHQLSGCENKTISASKHKHFSALQFKGHFQVFFFFFFFFVIIS